MRGRNKVLVVCRSGSAKIKKFSVLLNNRRGHHPGTADTGITFCSWDKGKSRTVYLYSVTKECKCTLGKDINGYRDILCDNEWRRRVFDASVSDVPGAGGWIAGILRLDGWKYQIYMFTQIEKEGECRCHDVGLEEAVLWVLTAWRFPFRPFRCCASYQ